MINLPDVTLIGIDNIDQDRLLKARDYCTRDINFGAEVLLTDVPIRSLADYSRFCIHDLYFHFDTSHCLIFHWDGFIIRPDLWDPKWLEYDYIGCPWYWLKVGNLNRAGKKIHQLVGNGGFSLRSKKLQTILASDFQNPDGRAEDAFICCDNYERLVNDYGIKFAPVEVARLFSRGESGYPNIETFGFHDKGMAANMEKNHGTP